MSMQSLETFRTQVNADQNLQMALRSVIPQGPDELVKLAKSKGFDFTAEELNDLMAETELSDLELELVSGGLPVNAGGDGTHTS